MPASTLVSDPRGAGLYKPLPALAMAVDVCAILLGNNHPGTSTNPTFQQQQKCHVRQAGMVLLGCGGGTWLGPQP